MSDQLFRSRFTCRTGVHVKSPGIDAVAPRVVKSSRCVLLEHRAFGFNTVTVTINSDFLSVASVVRGWIDSDCKAWLESPAIGAGIPRRGLCERGLGLLGNPMMRLKGRPILP